MIEFVDKTQETNGTPLNRANLMALQGFISNDISISEDGSVVTETNEKGQTKTTTFSKNQIIEVFVGEKTITKTTTFHADGSVTEVIS